MTKYTTQNTDKTLRISVVDYARAIALIAMAIYHFAWDLESFGFLRKGMTLEPQWRFFGRYIAASFLFLVGASAWLAHENRLSLLRRAKRIALIASAAAIITVVTFFATPKGFIFFGILHNIAVSSLLILLFMQRTAMFTLLAALSVFFVSRQFATSLPNLPAWSWTGLSRTVPVSNDYVPIFPWFGWVLLGLAAAKLFSAWNIWEKLAAIKPENLPGSGLCFLGRHSLAFYLLHQPVMIGLLYALVKTGLLRF